MESAGIVSLLLDGGYRSADCYGVLELADALPAGRAGAAVLRLEPLLEALVVCTVSFTALEEAF